MSVKVEAWGHYALFTRPEMKVERVSYDVLTPSAARGILESVYWHPGLRYSVDKIWVLNEIQFVNVRRNELSEKICPAKVLSAMKKSALPENIDRRTCIQQRASMMLKNVHYVFEAHFQMTEKAASYDNAGKFQDIIKRRLQKGQYYSQPYFGCRECTANVRLWEGENIPTIEESRDLGWMLYDMDYTNPDFIQPQFFHAKMNHGLIDLRKMEVVR